MKTSLFLRLFIFIFSSCQLSPNTQNVTKSQLLACETGDKNCPPIDIKRNSVKEQIIVYFLIDSKGTDINLFDSTYLSMIRITPADSIRSLTQGFINIEGKPSLNLTNLPDGKYYVHISGDDVGGIFQMQLLTTR